MFPGANEPMPLCYVFDDLTVLTPAEVMHFYGHDRVVDECLAHRISIHRWQPTTPGSMPAPETA